MSIEENKSIVRRYYAEMNSGNVEIIDELIAPDYVAHDPSLPPEMQHGADTLKHVVAMSRESFPGHQMTIESCICEGDIVAARLRFDGVYQGESNPGAKVTFTGLGMYRIDNGRIAEGWFSFDQPGMMRQIESKDKCDNAD